MATVAEPQTRTVAATRYVTPLREGGSLPAIIEADDDGMYVLKFRGAGQGPKALVAEFVSARLGHLLNLPVPEIVQIELDPILANAEPDPEIQDLIRTSGGLNFGMDYLPGALSYVAAVPHPVDPQLAARIIWFDAFLMNVDRTARNVNMLVWHDNLWLIDHGAALYPQHAWRNPVEQASTPFSAIKDHVLLGSASSISEADTVMRPGLTTDRLERIVDGIPEDWLEEAQADRMRYLLFLNARIASADRFVEEAERARTRSI